MIKFFESFSIAVEFNDNIVENAMRTCPVERITFTLNPFKAGARLQQLIEKRGLSIATFNMFWSAELKMVIKKKKKTFFFFEFLFEGGIDQKG